MHLKNKDFDETFTIYIGKINCGIAALKDILKRYHKLVYDIDSENRKLILKNIEYLESLIMEHNKKGFSFENEHFKKIYDLSISIFDMYKSAHHPFFLRAATNLQVLANFVLEHTQQNNSKNVA